MTSSNQSLSGFGDAAVGDGLSNNNTSFGNYGIALALCEGVSIVTLCATVWVMSCMVIYGMNSWKVMPKANRKLYATCFVMFASSTPKISTDVISYFVQISGARLNCELVYDIASVFGAPAFISAYIFLWLRQRSVITHPFLKAKQAKCTEVLCWAQLGYMLTTWAAMFVSFIIPTSFATIDNICIYNPIDERTDGSGTWDSVRSYVLTGLFLSGQASFLAFFLYPLLLARSRRKQLRVASRDGVDAFTSVIRRSIICSCIVIVSDVTALVLSNLLNPWGSPVGIASAIFNTSILINNLCTLALFASAKDILTVCCRRETVTDQTTSAYSISHPPANSQTRI